MKKNLWWESDRLGLQISEMNFLWWESEHMCVRLLMLIGTLVGARNWNSFYPETVYSTDSKWNGWSWKRTPVWKSVLHFSLCIGNGYRSHHLFDDRLGGFAWQNTRTPENTDFAHQQESAHTWKGKMVWSSNGLQTEREQKLWTDFAAVKTTTGPILEWKKRPQTPIQKRKKTYGVFLSTVSLALETRLHPTACVLPSVHQ